MKTTPGFLSKAALVALAAFVSFPAAQAQLTVVDSGYYVSPYYTHNSADGIISYDWDASAHLYYMTSAGFPDVTVWKANGSNPTSIYANPSNFAGASVRRIGDFMYFNDSDLSGNQFVRGYGPLSGLPSVANFSNTPNYALFGHGGDMFITGATGFGPARIYYSHLGGDGDLANDPAIDLVKPSDTNLGGSGPLTFDLAGNMYYAPGYGGSTIYKWSAQDLANAIANPLVNPLSTAGHLWFDYGALYPTVSGATSMLFDDNGDLLVTLTNFLDPSSLVKFGTNPDGTYDGAHSTILTDGGLLGEMRQMNGDLYVSSDNQIVQIVPEPGSIFLVAAGLACMLWTRPGIRARQRTLSE